MIRIPLLPPSQSQLFKCLRGWKPTKPLELDFGGNSYIRAYHRLCSGFNRDIGIYLTRKEFAEVIRCMLLISLLICVMDLI